MTHKALIRVYPGQEEIAKLDEKCGATLQYTKKKKKSGHTQEKRDILLIWNNGIDVKKSGTVLTESGILATLWLKSTKHVSETKHLLIILKSYPICRSQLLTCPVSVCDLRIRRVGPYCSLPFNFIRFFICPNEVTTVDVKKRLHTLWKEENVKNLQLHSSDACSYDVPWKDDQDRMV